MPSATPHASFLQSDESKSSGEVVLGSTAPAYTARVGKAAPSWVADAVVGSELTQISSAQFAGRYHILLFYPLDFTFVCPVRGC